MNIREEETRHKLWVRFNFSLFFPKASSISKAERQELRIVLDHTVSVQHNNMDPVLANILQRGGAQEGASSNAEACVTAVLVVDDAVSQVCVRICVLMCVCLFEGVNLFV
jgi:hypothetical protein